MKALLLAPMGSVHRRFNKANIEALRELGYEVELCANFENGEGPEIHNQAYAEECRQQGLKIHSIPFARHSLTGSLKCLPQLIRLLRTEKYDLVHTHTETGGLLLKLAHCAKGKSKFFYTPHGMSFWKGSGLKSQLIYRPLERWICAGMDMNLGINMEEVENLQRWNKKTGVYVHGVGLETGRFRNVDVDDDVDENGGYNEDEDENENHSNHSNHSNLSNSSNLSKPFSTTPNPIRAEFGLRDNDLLIVSIGELDDNKNHRVVIKALSEIEKTNFKYVICGVGPNKEMLQNLAQEYGLSEKVILAGYRSDVPAILNAADIFVFPSFHEGMPVSALEAMASGLPIICSQIRGNVDIVKHGDNGYLFAPDNDLALAICLQNLMSNDSKRFFMGKKNQELVKAFSREAVVKELKKIYSI